MRSTSTGATCSRVFIRGRGVRAWLEDERARLKAVALRSATQLAERTEGTVTWRSGAVVPAGAPDRPARRAALRRLMKTLDGWGTGRGARSVRNLREAPHAELEADPAPETRALAGAVRERVATCLRRRAAPSSDRPGASEARERLRHRLRWLGAATGARRGCRARGRRPARREPAPPNPRRVLVSLREPHGRQLPRPARESGRRLDHARAGADRGARDRCPGAMCWRQDSAADRLNRAGHEAADVRTLSLASGSGLAVSGAMYRRDDRIEFRCADHRRSAWENPAQPRAVLGRAQEPRPALTVLRERIMAVLAEAVDVRLRDLPVAGQPPRYDAYLAFSTGVEIFYGGRQAPAALPYFQRAAALDSTSRCR